MVKPVSAEGTSMNSTALTVCDVQRETFRTQSVRGGDAIVVHLRGNADIDAQDLLKTFLEGLHLEATRLGIRETVFDLDELYFMNSSCLSLLLRHVNALMQSPGAQPHRVKFRANPNLRWQRRSLQALRSYAPEIVSIE
jgi:anti-anti-sigma factor